MEIPAPLSRRLVQRPNYRAAASFYVQPFAPAKTVVGMQDDPSNDLYLKAADEFLNLSKTAETPFMRAYYERVALRYLSSEFAPASVHG